MSIDIDALLETIRRREHALARTAYAGRTKVTYDGPLAGAASPLDRPVLVWPDQKHLLPSRCWNCGHGPAGYVHHLPTDTDRNGATECMVCTRTVVRWRVVAPKPATGTDAPVIRGRPPKTTQVETLPRACCDCGGGPVKWGRSRCRRCAEHRRSTTLPERLLRLLAPGATLSMTRLRVELDTTTAGVRSVVREARARGAVIDAVPGGGYHRRVAAREGAG